MSAKVLTLKLWLRFWRLAEAMVLRLPDACKCGCDLEVGRSCGLDVGKSFRMWLQFGGWRKLANDFRRKVLT